MSVSASRNERSIDATAVAHALARRARQAQGACWLHAEVARRMAERLAVIRVQPERIIDWWPGWGGTGSLLTQTYPRAHLLAVEPNLDWLVRTQAALPSTWWPPSRWTRRAWQWVLEADVWAHDGAPPLEVDALAHGGAQLLWANMMLHAVADPPALMARWHQLLTVDGFVMFSCFGPDTLRELRPLYAQQGWQAPQADFVDMHDLGDMLVHAGFADPVMDQERLTLTWPDPRALLNEVREWGGNAAPHRFGGLRTPRWQRRLMAALQTLANSEGRLPLTVEVVYGHAFKAPPKIAVRSESTVSLEDMRGMVRRPRTTDRA
ncbi:MAG: biotin synthase [Pseudomonadota bacterium]